MTQVRSPPDKAHSAAVSPAEEQIFAQVVDLIRASHERVLTVVNSALIDLYWKVGELVVRKIDTDGWGKGTVAALSTYIQKRHPGLQGFSPQNVWRMRQFFDAYRDRPDLSTLLRELPWSANLHVLTKCKSPEEREFTCGRLSPSGGPFERWPARSMAHCSSGQLSPHTKLHEEMIPGVTLQTRLSFVMLKRLATR